VRSDCWRRPRPAPTGEPPGVRRQLTFLRAALDAGAGAGDDAQQWFPEGYFFLHAWYGLTWVELGMRSPGERATALREARWALGPGPAPAAARVRNGRPLMGATPRRIDKVFR